MSNQQFASYLNNHSELALEELTAYNTDSFWIGQNDSDLVQQVNSEACEVEQVEDSWVGFEGLYSL